MMPYVSTQSAPAPPPANPEINDREALRSLVFDYLGSDDALRTLHVRRTTLGQRLRFLVADEAETLGFNPRRIRIQVDYLCNHLLANPNRRGKLRQWAQDIFREELSPAELRLITDAMTLIADVIEKGETIQA